MNLTQRVNKLPNLKCKSELVPQGPYSAANVPHFLTCLRMTSLIARLGERSGGGGGAALERPDGRWFEVSRSVYTYQILLDGEQS